ASMWFEFGVHFEDPADRLPPDSSSNAAQAEIVVQLSRSPEVVHRETPEWPAAAPYLCHGRLQVQIVVDASGRTRGARITQRFVECKEGMGTAIDSAAVRAARRCRYRPALVAGAGGPSVVPIVFEIPEPRTDGTVIVGCLRDSLSGRPMRGEIGGEDGARIGETDANGWFVLTASPAHHEGPRLLRALVPCHDSQS